MQLWIASYQRRHRATMSSFLVFFSLGKLALFSIAIAFVHITFAVQYKLSRHY